jgi:hypothetical protein
LPSENSLTSTVAELIHDLMRAFDQTAGPDPDPSYTRARYITALQSVARFLDRVPTLQDFAHEFVKLASALDDLNQGTVHPILRPSNVASRPPDSTETWMARAKVAFTVEILLRSKMTETEVKDLIDEDFPTIIGFAKRSRSAGQASITWRNMFVRRRVKNRIAAEVFKQKLAEIDAKIVSLSPAAMRSVAIQMLREAVAKAAS